MTTTTHTRFYNIITRFLPYLSEKSYMHIKPPIFVQLERRSQFYEGDFITLKIGDRYKCVISEKSW